MSDSFSDIPDDEFLSATQSIESAYLFPEDIAVMNDNQFPHHELSQEDIASISTLLDEQPAVDKSKNTTYDNIGLYLNWCPHTI